MINSFTALQVPHDGFSLMFQDSKAGSNFVFCGQIKTNTDIYGQKRTLRPRSCIIFAVLNN